MKPINPCGTNAFSFLRSSNKKSIGGSIQLICVILALILGGLSTHAWADAVTLAWDANQPTPDGYRVFHRVAGQSYNYTQPGCQTSGTSCTVNNLAPNTTYHFVVRAYVGSDISGDSNEASHTTGAPPRPDHTISASAGTNGNITPSGEVSVADGSDRRFDITADPGYQVSDVRVDGQSVGAVNSYQFTNITSDHSIEALFEQSNQAPTADAGADQTAEASVAVTLDGSGSRDPDAGDSITGYRWRQVSGASVQISEANTARARFTTPNVLAGGQALEFELTVTDQSGASATDRCIVNVTKDNQPPQADAGIQQQVNEGDNVSLDGSGSSDPDNDPILFQWQQTQGPTVTLTQSQTATPQFYAPDVGKSGATLTFQLTVTDSKGLKATDTCQITVDWINSPPKAHAGAMQTVTSGQLVYLDGAGSSDPDGDLDRYQWAQTSGAEVTLSDPSDSRPSFVAPEVDADGATLMFELAVYDSASLSSSDTCLVRVQSDAGVDTDGDGYNDNIDAFPDDKDEWMDTDADGVGNNADTDDDGDGMSDTWEIQYGFDPLDPEDADLDPDGDGLTNRIEAQGGTNPNIAEASGGWAPSVINPTEGHTNVPVHNTTIEIDTEDHQGKDATIRQTLWQILSEDGQMVVFNIISDEHLSKIRIPMMVLAPETAYLCRVRCYDSNDQISDWSLATTFVTEDIENDNDENGVPDDRQVTIGSDPQSTDAIPANLSLSQKTGIESVDVFADNENTSLVSAMYVDPVEIEEAPQAPLATPFAMVANKVVTDTGEQVTLQIHFDAPQTPGALQWMKYDAVNGWQDYTDATMLEENAQTMNVTVKDGGDGDADGVANGTIINLSGPAAVGGQSNGRPSAAPNSSGQCFIQLMRQ